MQKQKDGNEKGSYCTPTKQIKGSSLGQHHCQKDRAVSNTSRMQKQKDGNEKGSYWLYPKTDQRVFIGAAS
jgi:hypothetical protein